MVLSSDQLAAKLLSEDSENIRSFLMRHHQLLVEFAQDFLFLLQRLLGAHHLEVMADSGQHICWVKRLADEVGTPG